jgi:hypothetical protein
LNWDALREPDGGVFDGGIDVIEPVDAQEAEAQTIDAPNDVTDATTCQIDLVINEVQAGGQQGPSDEFVELRNGAPCGGSLLDWGLRYSSASGSAPSQLWTGQAGDTIAAHGYVILGGYAFQAPQDAGVIGRISTDLNGSLAAGGGGVGLFDPGGTLVDGVAYETLTTQTHPFIRPSNAGSTGGAPNPPTGKSIARTPDGANTNTNATDFQVATPSPGFSN